MNRYGGLLAIMRNLAAIGLLLMANASCSRPARAEENQPATPAPAVPPAPPASSAATIQDNMEVGFEYTLTVDGAVVDSTEGKEPFHYVHGQYQIVPGLERELTGLKVGDTKEVTVKPEDGYGKTDPAAVIELPKTQLPSDVTPAVGMVLRGVNPDGKMFRATVTGVKDQTVSLDLNHPLAGKTLAFKVKVIDIKPAQAHTP